MYNKLLNNLVPKNWEKKAYPSLKKLGSWYDDLINRIEFFHSWYEKGNPKAYLLSAFFFP